ncbi:MAG: 3-isopropylmalate dehydratase, partial [Methanobrevibacter sp.]|nr:3-isopropylmalate dehydratase [Methanobrevibacter sp.]
IGLPVIVCDIEAKDGDIISIDLSKGQLVNETNGQSDTFEPFKDFMLNILEDGGLVNHYLNDKD